MNPTQNEAHLSRESERNKYRRRRGFQSTSKDRRRRYLRNKNSLSSSSKKILNVTDEEVLRHLQNFSDKISNSTNYYELKAKVTEQIMNEYDEYGFKYSVGYTKYNKERYDEVEDM